jgi:protoheme IX farnesyltransferase
VQAFADCSRLCHEFLPPQSACIDNVGNSYVMTTAAQASSNLNPVNNSVGDPLDSAAEATLAAQLRVASRHSLFADYKELFKVRVTSMVVLTAWAGFYLGSLRSGISTLHIGLFEALVGIALVSAGASALNEVMERKSDAKMLRTADRPLATGRISLAHGVIAGMLAIIGGTLVLTQYTNPVTGLLTLLTAVMYVTVYTPLKRITTMATFIGAFPGAMGPLLGWTAARGVIEWPAVALFAVLFVWQFPHFMAIAWLYRDDYGRAGIKMLPVVEPDGWSTVVQALFYAIIMVPVSVLPWYLHLTGVVYAVAAVLLSLGYLYFTIRFSRIPRVGSKVESRKLASQLLRASVIYLPLLLIVMMLDATGGR